MTPAALVVEEPGLPIEAAAVPDQRSRRADHSMARHDDRDRVGAVGGADGTRGAGRPEGACDSSITRRLAWWNGPQRYPHPFLECGAPHVEWNVVEVRARAREVRVEPRARADDGRCVAVSNLVRREPAAKSSLETRQPFFRSDELERAQAFTGIEREHVANRRREDGAREDHVF